MLSTYRHYLLLLWLLALLVLGVAGRPGPITQAIFEIVIALTVVTVVGGVGSRGPLRGIGAALGAVVIGMRVWAAFHGGVDVSTVGQIVVVGFFAFAAVSLLRAVVRATDVTGDTIAAALCAYLLLGVLWGFAYAAIELVSPGAFHLPGNVPRDGSALRDFLYFSFVTLTTLGYGDVTPLKPAARIVAALEAVVGQFYVAVLVARLVGIHASRSVDGRRDP